MGCFSLCETGSVYRLMWLLCIILQTRPPVREQLIPAVNVISQSRATFNSTLGQQPAASHSVTAEEQSRYH